MDAKQVDEADPQPLLALADRAGEILAEFGSREELDGLAKQMGCFIAEFDPRPEI